MKRRLVIAQVTNGSVRVPSKTAGGVESTIPHLSKEYEQLGHTSVVIDNCYPEYSDSCGVSKELGLRVYRVNALRLIDVPSNFNWASRILRFLNRSWFMFHAAIILRKMNVDVVQTYDVFSIPILSVLVSRSKIVFTHSSSFWPIVPQSHVSAFLTRAFVPILNMTTCNVVQNYDVGRELERNGVSSSKIAVIPPSGNVGEIGRKSDEKHNPARSGEHQSPFVLFVGRVCHEKGVDVLLRAVDEVVNHRKKNLLLIVAGPLGEFDKSDEKGKYVSDLLAFVKGRHLDAHVRFVGMIPSEELMSLYEDCTCLVLPSRRESFGHVISEAFYFGKPVIATNTSGARMQIMNGVNGFVVPAEDYMEMAKQLMILTGNPELVSKLGEQGRKSVAERSWSNVARRYIDLYNDSNDSTHLEAKNS